MIDKTKSIKFYDPIYDVITIKPREIDIYGGRNIFYTDRSDDENAHLLENIVVKLLKSPQVARLNYLKQAACAFLVYPSATHTRFAHSLGTLYLGMEALDRCWAEIRSKKRKKEIRNIISLRKLVEDAELDDEFLIALFLHDIGHFPFSHILESNYELPLKLPKHEEISVDYITDGPYSSGFGQYLSNKFGITDYKSLSKFIDQLDKDIHKKINKKIICYLICRDDKYLYNEPRKEKEVAKMLSELTSGLLDLDRFDHYNRDSFFMGTKLARFNVRSFLDDVIITDNGIKLKCDGVSHALSLLQSQENIKTYNFEDEEVLAYEAMFNYCISRYFLNLQKSDKKDFARQSKELMYWTDEELIQKLLSSEIEEIKRTIFKIMCQTPYECLKKYDRIKDEYRKAEDLVKLRHEILNEFRNEVEDHQLLFRIPGGYGIKPDPKNEWLYIDMLKDEHGHELRKAIPAFRDEINFLSERLKSHREELWVFCDGVNEEMKNKIKSKLNTRLWEG